MNDNDFSFTENGSLYSEQYGDVYYTDGKGKEESLYVFLDANQVQNRLNSREKLVIGELGFGTGLNFLLCWQAYLDSGGDQGLDFVVRRKRQAGCSPHAAAKNRHLGPGFRVFLHCFDCL